MDVFKAYQEFSAPGNHVLALLRGDRIDVLEAASGRHRQEWWAARRIRDNALGFVPSKYLEFDEFISLDYLPADFEQQREVHLRQLAMMERAPTFPVEDPEGWHDYNERSNTPPQYFYQGPPNKNLSESEWQNILDAAEGEVVEPEPDYGEDEEEEETHDRSNGSNGSASPASPMSPAKIIQPHPTAYQSQSEGDLHLPPKKLVNPCVESKERSALHRELMMNQRRGVDVLNKKSELKKALEKRTDDQKKREFQEFEKSKKSVFQKKLEEQAEKMKPYTVGTLKKNTEPDKSKSTPELNEMSPKILRKTVPPSSKPQTPTEEDVPEFLRVHTKIYKNKAPIS